MSDCKQVTFQIFEETTAVTSAVRADAKSDSCVPMISNNSEHAEKRRCDSSTSSLINAKPPNVSIENTTSITSQPQVEKNKQVLSENVKESSQNQEDSTGKSILHEVLEAWIAMGWIQH